MKIVADQNIPYVKEAFGSLGEVITVAGNDITPELVKDATILLVRSVTKVNEQLLAKSSVKFVATATIGRDHIDEQWLASANIGFASAPASNANSVAEWIITALYLVAQDQGVSLVGKKLAIIGVGNIGSRLQTKAENIGMQVVLNDPPKAAEGNKEFVPLQEALSDADYVSFHVPLTSDGKWPTTRMINDSLLSMIKDGAVFLNAARGRTMDEAAMLKHADRFTTLFMDVWPEEPKINEELMHKSRIVSPHIAGYSFDGKCTGTGMIYRAASQFFDQPITWSENEILDAVITEPIVYAEKSGITGVLLKAFDIFGDDARMRGILNQDESERVAYFSKLRKEYPRRYEFRHFTVTACKNEQDAAVLRSLGFILND